MLEKPTIVEEKRVCEKSAHKPVQLSLFRLVYLEVNPLFSLKPVNKPSLITESTNRSIMYQYYLQDNYKFWQRFHIYLIRRTHTTPMNFVFLLPKITDGQLSPLKLQIVCALYSFTSPRIEKFQFIMRRLNFLDKPCVHIIFQYLKIE